MNSLAHLSLNDIQIPENTSDSQNFLSQAEACLEAIQTCAGPSLANNTQRREKYFKLSELGERIKSQDTGPSQELATLKLKVKNEMKALKDQYQTNSHWLVLTQHQSHFVQAQPDISSEPKVRVDPSDLKASFKAIADLPRGLEKVRALQYLFELSLSSDNGNTPELIKEIQRFSDSHLSLSEKILALKQINWRDKNPLQMSELNSLIDPTGKNFAQYFLTEQTTPKDAVSYLTVVLKDRLLHSPKVKPVELLKSWPQSIHNQSTASRKDWAIALMKMLTKSSIQDSFTNLVIDYLLNIVDPSGIIRCDELYNKHRSGNSFAREVANVIDTLETFGFEANAIRQIYNFSKKSNQTKAVPPLEQLESKMISEPLSEKEIKQFAEAMKSLVAREWLSFDMKSFLAGTKTFGELVGDRMEKGAQLAEKYERALKKIDDPKIQGAMIGNVLQLCHRLMQTGEFSLSFTLFSTGIDFTRKSCENGWEIALKKFHKYDDFLLKVCNPARNLRNLRKLISNREEKFPCIPFFPIATKDIVQLEEQISQPRDHLVGLLFEEHPVIASQVVSALSGVKVMESAEKWAQSHFFKDIQKLFRIVESVDSPFEEKSVVRKKIIDVLLQEKELQIEILMKKRALSRGIALIDLHYGNKSSEDNLSVLLTDD